MNDHPFLRQFAHLNIQSNFDGKSGFSNEAKSQMRQPNETELDYYERRYKERVFASSLFIFKVFSKFHQVSVCS
jgi:hypothetical protein